MGLWSRIERWPIVRRLTIIYSPRVDDRAFLRDAQMQQQDGLEVTVAVLDAHQSRQFFGVPMARRGIQPVWLRIVNRSDASCRLHLVSIDPNYFSPHEAAAANHYSFGKRLIGFGLLGLVFLQLLLVLIPLKLIGARRANRQMDEFFREHAFRLRPIAPGKASEGFVFTPLDVGSKAVHVRILRLKGAAEFVFNISVAGIDVDYGRRDFLDLYPPDRLIECDMPTLCDRLRAMPRAVNNANGSREGDPVNLVVVGDFPTVMGAFAARWDETEIISWATCRKTARAFLFGTEYRYSPVSALYLFGRSQDFALQRIRESINERLHLRLWLTELRHDGKPVWVGQVSRDIGVRFTLKTWNLTTHRIDPDVDESRDYVLEDLLEAQRLELVGYVAGVGECGRESPRHNLTGDPYFTDGERGIAIVSPARTTAKFLGRT
jgi:hypothetical protein